MTEDRPRAPSAAPVPPAEDETVDLGDLRWDDTLAFLLFWLLAGVVFLQFFTRYVMNDSYGWTEEIARFLLIGVCFVGSVMAVRKESHIAVEIFYRWMPLAMRKAMSTFVDLTAIVFYGYMAWLCSQLARRTGQMMVSIDIPKSWVYWIVAAAFVAMTLYAVIVAVRHWRTGTSRLIAQAETGSRLPAME